ncbi:MAG: hypothetical protein NTZ50_08625 [Chloroflexi bacterium]|nr:hypothetical protein [Chloroflexota bacterium]
MALHDRFPFARFDVRLRQRAFVGAFVASVAVSAVLASVGAPLTMAAVPGGIVDFEFAGNATQSMRIMAAWGAAGVAAAQLQTWLDYAYIATYGPSLALAVGLTIGVWARRGVWFGRAGVALSWGALAASAFDAIENVLLLMQLSGGASEAAALTAKIAAGAKFVLIIATAVYALFGAALWSTDRLIAVVRRAFVGGE